MKSLVHFLRRNPLPVARALSALALAVCAGCSSGPTSTASKSDNAATKIVTERASSPPAKDNALAAAPKSVFHADPQTARDPFFPNSKRSLAKASDAASGPRLPLTSYLKLVGIRPGISRPLALINKTTFAPGEEANVSIVLSNQLNLAEVQKVNVRCLEIRRDSVLITIAGEQGVKELRLAQGRN